MTADVLQVALVAYSFQEQGTLLNYCSATRQCSTDGLSVRLHSMRFGSPKRRL